MLRYGYYTETVEFQRSVDCHFEVHWDPVFRCLSDLVDLIRDQVLLKN